MMNQKHVRHLFVPYHEEVLDAASRRAVEAHLKNCPACRSCFEKLPDILDNPNPALLPRINAVPLEQWQKAAEPGYLLRPPPAGTILEWSAGGALALIAVLIGIFLGSGPGGPTPAEDEIAAAYYQAVSQQEMQDAFQEIMILEGEESR